MLRSSTSSQVQSGFQEALSALNGTYTRMRINSITKSFRLDEDIIKKIDQQARNNNTSLNAEINSILRKYVEWDMLASKIEMIPIARPVLSEIFQNIMTKEQVINLANRTAKNAIREIAHFMKGGLTLRLFLSWFRTRMEYCSEINYAIENTSDSHRQIRLIIKHDLGENWSIYHKIILEYIFHEILHEDTVEIGVSDTTLVLYFKEIT